MWRKYINATNLDEALAALNEYQGKARIIAGGTDLILEMERGVRKDIEVLVDVTRVDGLDQITLDEQQIIHLGPMVTHNQCVASKLIRENAFPLAQACWQVGSPQIRNRGTIAGNVITASPANDSIAPLMALGAKVTLRSQKGERIVALEDFYTGVRKTVMQPDELLVDIAFHAMQAKQKGVYTKYALRRAQAISVVNSTIILTFDKERVLHSSITMGAVAPTIIHAKEAEAFLIGKKLSSQTIEAAAELISKASTPITDIRSSAQYRQEIIKVISRRGLTAIAEGKERVGFPLQPVMLWGATERKQTNTGGGIIDQDSPIETTINGKSYKFNNGQSKTLLRLLREEAELIGTKEGCAEGECGACTVYLDGEAVMSCLVPAPRTHHATITTIEGIADGDRLHPVQQAFIQEGAVQCGYCTPGFIMSAVKLLEENPKPSEEQIKYAITGNLCRCTGYYKIVKAIEQASVQK
ncbi:MAG: FAD binding domain-containing protein [Anaerolineaceae bacterium]|jgi:carbon-monoxide dehydrogenase medium subunit